jgi:ribosomal protein S18 acetylase RimI-like enzyme
MTADLIHIKSWDESISRTVIIDLLNQQNKYLNPKDPIEATEELLNFFLGETTVLSRDVLRFENNQSNIIGFAGIIKSPMYKDTWVVGYGILPEYFKTDLPEKLIDASLNLGMELKVPELLFGTTGTLSAPFDEKLESLGFTPIQYTWSMRLDNFSLFKLPKVPHEISIQKNLEIDDYQSYANVINQAFQDHFKWENKTEEMYKQINDMIQKTNEIEHYLTYEDNKLVGTCIGIINPKQKFVGSIGNFGILPSHQHRGIGSSLFAFGVESLREKGCKEINLLVEAKNEKALDLYKKFGFIIQDHLTEKRYQII